MMAVVHSLKGTAPFSFSVSLFSLVVTHYHSLSLFVTRCHSLSLDVPLACVFTNDHSFVINDVYKNLKQNVNIKVKSKHKVVFRTLY